MWARIYYQFGRGISSIFLGAFFIQIIIAVSLGITWATVGLSLSTPGQLLSDILLLSLIGDIIMTALALYKDDLFACYDRLVFIAGAITCASTTFYLAPKVALMMPSSISGWILLSVLLAAIGYGAGYTFCQLSDKIARKLCWFGEAHDRVKLAVKKVTKLRSAETEDSLGDADPAFVAVKNAQDYLRQLANNLALAEWRHQIAEAKMIAEEAAAYTVEAADCVVAEKEKCIFDERPEYWRWLHRIYGAARDIQWYGIHTCIRYSCHNG